MDSYKTGISGEGADAYTSLLLCKCMLLQKWFHIESNPELESYINDRLSFKKFLEISFSQPSPDHSTFSRFRKRLSENAINQINTEILNQFEALYFTIYKGIAVDTRLVKSASSRLSNDEIDDLKQKISKPEGKLDANYKPVKFLRAVESNWTVKNDTPHYGLIEHTFVDVNNGFILAATSTPAPENDSKFSPYCTIYSRHSSQPINKVYAYKCYFGNPNREFLNLITTRPLHNP